MFFQVIVFVTLVIFVHAAPQEHHATSYVSNNLAGHGELGGDGEGLGSYGAGLGSYSGGLGSYYSAGLEGNGAGLGSHYVHYAAPTLIKHVPVIVKHEEEGDYKEEEHGPAKYEFHYAVEDKHTGDIKSQKESRDGHVVKGEYSLKEADGTIRVVKYSADKKSGFNAVVIRQGHAAHPQVEEKKVEVKKILVPVHHDYYHGLESHY